MKFQIRIKNPIVQHITLFVLTCSIVFLIPDFGETFFMIKLILCTILSMTFGYSLTDKLLEGSMTTSIENNEVSFKWDKKPIVTSVKNQVICFDNIRSWKLIEQRFYHYFIIYVKKGDYIIFYRDSSWDEEQDDFKQFIIEFRNAIDKYNEVISTNEEITDSQPKIRDLEREYYASTKAKLLYYTYILTAISAVAFLILYREKLELSGTLMVFSGLAGCIYLIKNHKKKMP